MQIIAKSSNMGYYLKIIKALKFKFLIACIQIEKHKRFGVVAHHKINAPQFKKIGCQEA